MDGQHRRSVSVLIRRSVGRVQTREYSIDPLETFFAHEVMTPDPATLNADDQLDTVLTERDRITRTRESHPHPYAILDRRGAVAGVLTHRELLAAASTEPPHRTVGELAHPADTLVHPDQTLREMATAFAASGATRAPVVDRGDPGRLLGMITLAHLLHARRHDHQEEHHRQRHLPSHGRTARTHPPHGPEHTGPEHTGPGTSRPHRAAEISPSKSIK